MIIILTGCKQKVDIDYAEIRPELLAEGHKFNFVFNIRNEWQVEGWVNYSYRYIPHCVEINGSEEGRLYLHKGNNPYYTQFYVQDNLSFDCYSKLPILLIIENSKGIIDTEQVDMTIALNTMDIPRYQRYNKLIEGIV